MKDRRFMNYRGAAAVISVLAFLILYTACQSGGSGGAGAKGGSSQHTAMSLTIKVPDIAARSIGPQALSRQLDIRIAVYPEGNPSAAQDFFFTNTFGPSSGETVHVSFEAPNGARQVIEVWSIWTWLYNWQDYDCNAFPGSYFLSESPSPPLLLDGGSVKNADTGEVITSLSIHLIPAESGDLAGIFGTLLESNGTDPLLYQDCQIMLMATVRDRSWNNATWNFPICNAGGIIHAGITTEELPGRYSIYGLPLGDQFELSVSDSDKGWYSDYQVINLAGDTMQQDVTVKGMEPLGISPSNEVLVNPIAGETVIFEAAGGYGADQLTGYDWSNENESVGSFGSPVYTLTGELGNDVIHVMETCTGNTAHTSFVTSSGPRSQTGVAMYPSPGTTVNDRDGSSSGTEVYLTGYRTFNAEPLSEPLTLTTSNTSIIQHAGSGDDYLAAYGGTGITPAASDEGPSLAYFAPTTVSGTTLAKIRVSDHGFTADLAITVINDEGACVQRVELLPGSTPLLNDSDIMSANNSLLLTGLRYYADCSSAQITLSSGNLSITKHAGSGDDRLDFGTASSVFHPSATAADATYTAPTSVLSSDTARVTLSYDSYTASLVIFIINDDPGDPPQDMIGNSSSCFIMGDCQGWSGVGDGETPATKVCNSEYWIDLHEVTNKEYRLCVDLGYCINPGDLGSATRTHYYDNSSYEDYPVIHVTWQQADDYCSFALKRLPTEAEWEHAARFLTGDTSCYTYSTGNAIGCADADLGRANSGAPCWNIGGLENDTHQVQSYLPNTQGVYDMDGNVDEWVNDRYAQSYYGTRLSTWIMLDPDGPGTGTDRVIRGSAWNDVPNTSIRSSRRMSQPPTFSSDNTGFRCAGDKPTFFSLFVSAGTGSDTNPGTPSQPLKSITQAMFLLSSALSKPADIISVYRVFVRNGVYNAANGESFPIVVLDNVELVGEDSTNTQIVGFGDQGGAIDPTTVILGNNSLLHSFNIPSWSQPLYRSVWIHNVVNARLQNVQFSGSNPVYASIVLDGYTTAIADVTGCEFLSGGTYGVYANGMEGGSPNFYTGLWGNNFSGVYSNGVSAYLDFYLRFIGNSISNVSTYAVYLRLYSQGYFRQNTITNNSYGITIVGGTADLGNNAFSDPGMNTLMLNSFTDLYLDNSNYCFGPYLNAFGNDWDGGRDNPDSPGDIDFIYGCVQWTAAIFYCYCP